MDDNEAWKGHRAGAVGIGKSIACYPSESIWHREDNKKEADRMTASGCQCPLPFTAPASAQ